MGDPLSAMMNFISDVNPLASVFKSPDGASPAASSRVWYSETPRDLATDALLPRHRQASRALRRRPAGVRPRPPRAGEREFALRHPQPPQRGVDASHRQREGDTTARGGEGACAFQRFTFPSLTVGGFSNAARASALRGIGAIRPCFAPKPRKPDRGCDDLAPRGGAGASARAILGAEGLLSRPSIVIINFLGTSTARSDARTYSKIAIESGSRFFENATWPDAGAFFRRVDRAPCTRRDAMARTDSDPPHDPTMAFNPNT